MCSTESHDPGTFALHRTALLGTARAAIQHGLRHGQPYRAEPAHQPPALRSPGACFVTLHLDDELRGCIGSLEAYRPLIEDIAANAYAAAFRDPRFLPLTEREYARMSLHISILRPAQALQFESETDLLRQIRPGIDGMILEAGNRRGTFLPAVWEALPDPREFLAQLKRKAGLPADYWGNDVRVWRYTTESIEEAA